MRNAKLNKARRQARADVDEKLEAFYRQHREDVARWKLTRDEQRTLALLTRKRITGRALLSNIHVRRAAAYALIDAVLDFWSRDPDRQLYFVTLCWDDGVTWEREPWIQFDALVNKAQEHLRRQGLDGVGAAEIDVWKNFTGEPGRRMVAHVHFIGWARDPEAFHRMKAESSLCASVALTNSLGADPATVRIITQTAGDVAHMAYYLLKAPAGAKNPVPRGDAHVLEPVWHARGSATRLLEILSHVELGDVLFSVGQGKPLAAAVRAAASRVVSVSNHYPPVPGREEIAKFWREIRKVNGRASFVEPKIQTRHTRRQSRDKLRRGET